MFRVLVILRVFSLDRAHLHYQSVSGSKQRPFFLTFSSVPFVFIVSGLQRAQRASPVGGDYMSTFSVESQRLLPSYETHALDF